MNSLEKISVFLQKRFLKIEKRVRLVLSVSLLTCILLISTFFQFDSAFFFIPLFIIVVFMLSYFAILVGVEKVEWLMLFIMPITLTISFYLFYFLFPVRWLTRLPFVILYGVSMYAILLCSNIFNVGVEKSLQLYRPAFFINFFLQIFVSLLLFNTLFSFKLNFLLNTFAVGFIAFWLSLQLFWTLKLDLKLTKKLVLYSCFIALLLSELVLVWSFVPIKSSILALFLASSYYSLSGLIYNFLDQRLFKETIREYVIVWIGVLGITALSISW